MTDLIWHDGFDLPPHIGIKKRNNLTGHLKRTNLHHTWDSAMIDRYLDGNQWTDLVSELEQSLSANPSVVAAYGE